MIRARLFVGAMLLLLAAIPLRAQFGDGHIRTGDSLKVDRGIDSLATDDTLNPDEAFFQEIDSTEEPVELPEPETFFKVRGGFFGGGAAELTSLDPSALDPVLDGTLVQYGIEGYVLMNSWMIGGTGVSSTLYGMSDNYDRFTFGYGGFLTGYDTKIFYGAMSLQGSLLIGAGGLEMIKRRPDLGGAPGREIMERVREESFFCVRPGLSLGYAPVAFLRFSAGVTYLYALGGNDVADLRNVSYGLHVTLGIGD